MALDNGVNVLIVTTGDDSDRESRSFRYEASRLFDIGTNIHYAVPAIAPEVSGRELVKPRNYHFVVIMPKMAETFGTHAVIEKKEIRMPEKAQEYGVRQPARMRFDSKLRKLP